MELDKTLFKGGVATLGTIITYMTNAFSPLMVILILFAMVDYITGMISANLNEGWSSKEAYRGVIKKFSYFFMVMLAFGFDFAIDELTRKFGFNLSFPAVFGVLTVCWLISTDGISILENLVEIGLPVPNFLINGLKVFRDKVEERSSEKQNLQEEEKIKDLSSREGGSTL